MAKKKKNESAEVKKAEKKVQVPIKWNVPDALNSIYANNMLVQLLENEFKILFFETKPTPRMSAEDIYEKEVRADCVASIIVSPMKLPAFIGVLQRQFEVFLKREGMIVDQSGKVIPIEPERLS